MRTALPLLLCQLVLATMVTACAGSGAAGSSSPSGSGGIDIALPDLQGAMITPTAQAEDNVFVLAFWATWCQPCQQELTKMNKMNKMYPGMTTTVLVEGKQYRDYLMAVGQNALLQYTENPTLEREDQQVPGNLNATGGRVRVDHTWRERGLTVFGNTLAYAYAQNAREEQFTLEGSEGLLATHNFGGIIYRKPKSDFVAQVSAGYRHERWLREPTPGEGSLKRRFPHAEFYVTVPVARTGKLIHALSFRDEGRLENFVTVGQREDFFRGLFTVGYSMSPWFSITYLQGFDTELPTPQGEVSLTDEECSGGPGSTCRPHLWPGMQARINFWGSSFIRIFAGRQVGGRVCVNGSCRTLPDFEGVRSELVFSF